MKHPLARPSRPRRPDSFTLVEMLAVLVIIAILVGLTLAAASGVMKTAARSRAKAEIAAMGGALDSYKSDNGMYPAVVGGGFNTTNDYVTAVAGSSIGQYAQSSAYLYEQLSGNTQAGATYAVVTGTAPPGHIYMTFKASQLGNYSAAGTGPIFIKDPFGNSYGYYAESVANMDTATTANPTADSSYYPFNGKGQYDLWSTAGDVTGANITSWVTDWNN